MAEQHDHSCAADIQKKCRRITEKYYKNEELSENDLRFLVDLAQTYVRVQFEVDRLCHLVEDLTCEIGRGPHFLIHE